MEENVFPHPAVAGQLNKMVEARLHNDGAIQDEIKALQQELTGSLATPSYVILDPQTGDVVATQLGPEMDEETFGRWLASGLE